MSSRIRAVARLAVCAASLTGALRVAHAKPVPKVTLTVVAGETRVVMKQAAERFMKANPDVRVEVLRRSGLLAPIDFCAGKADVMAVTGPGDILQHRYLKDGRWKWGSLGDVFEKGQLEGHVIAYRTLALIVNPKCKLEEIRHETVKGIILSFRNTKNPDPLKHMNMSYLRDWYSCNILMASRIFDTTDRIGMSAFPSVHPRMDLLKAVKNNPRLIGFTAMDRRLPLTGLKILPLRVAPDKVAVMPTYKNVVSGAYPYCLSLKVVVHPKAPPAAKELLKELIGPKARQKLAEGAWMVAPDKPQAGTKPRTPQAPTQPAGKVDVSGAASLTGALRVAHAKPVPKVTLTVVAGESFRIMKLAADRFMRANPDVRVEVLYRPGLSTSIAFCAGKTDVMAVTGSGDILQHRYLDLKNPKRKWGLFGDVFEKGQLEPHVIAYRTLALIVNPKCKLKEIRHETVKGIIQSFRNTKNPDPLKHMNMSYLRDKYSCGTLMVERIFDATDYISMSRFPSVHPRMDLLKAVKNNPRLIGFTAMDQRLPLTGLKILPLRVAPDKAAVMPTYKNVVSGAYPYSVSLKVVVHPKAPPAAKELLKELIGPKARQTLAEGAWMVAPDKPRTGIPQMPDSATQPAEKVDVSGAVAILPTRSLSRHFMMAGSAHHALYDQNVRKGIASDKRLKIVDRSQLQRILAEKRLMLAAGASWSGKPIVAADVLVLIHVVSEKSAAYLRVQAFHSATASCLSELKVRIDPANPTRFPTPLDKQVARWWPGVLANLQAANTRPVWALVEGDSTAPAKDRDAVRAALERALSADKRLFYARPRMISDAQMEVLMRIMGLSKPKAGRFVPAADYVLEFRAEGGGRTGLRLLRGTDTKTLAEAAMPIAGLGKWVSSQVGAHSDKPVSRLGGTDLAAARKQARMEYQRGMELKKRRQPLLKNEYHLTGEQKALFESLRAQMHAHFVRSCQLDPTLPEPQLELIYSLPPERTNYYEGYRQRAKLYVQFIERWPNYKGTPDRIRRIIYSYLHWAQCVGDKTGRKWAKVPAGTDHRREYKDAVRSALLWCSRYAARYIKERRHDDPDGKWSFKLIRGFHRGYLAKYTKLDNVSEAEAREAIAEWSQAVDGHPEIVEHSDFQRLRYYVKEDNKQAYLKLLTAMQKRWPDPKDAQWKLAKDQVLNDLSEMFRMDERGTSFHQWLRGKRGIGDLPYVGYEPNEKDPKAKGGT